MKPNNLFKALALLAILIIVAAIISVSPQFDSSQPAPEQRQNFFQQFFIAGGPVVWFVLFPLSLLTAYLIFEHLLEINKKSLLSCDSPEQLKNKIDTAGPAGLLLSLAQRADLVSVAIRDGLEKSKGDWFTMKSSIQESLQDQAGMLLRKIEWLNLIGAVSPMVGLFGTVFGMIKLFNAIVSAGGQPQPAQLADGIGIALVTTFWGLFIAIPALAMHGIFRNRIEALVSDAVTQSQNLMPLLRDSLKDGHPAAGELKFKKIPIVSSQNSQPKSPDAASLQGKQN
ncbi:MAG: MotA/TolQ/ExbB proton channel family protein [Phycisphaerae bacterium]|jgi:biopolymer transport protein ExbB